MTTACLLFCRLLRASFANVTTFLVITTMDYLVLEQIMERVNVESAFANQAGRVLTVLAETAPTLALHLVSFANVRFTVLVWMCVTNFFFTGGGDICSGKGDCVCGECQCYEEDGGRYSGKFCEECPVILPLKPKCKIVVNCIHFFSRPVQASAPNTLHVFNVKSSNRANSPRKSALTALSCPSN